MINIGRYQLAGRAVLAPMAGVTDFPFRQICRRLGASMVTAEMSGSNPALRDTRKSQLRLANPDDAEPRTIQIVGTEPLQMAAAARYQVESGAQIVDINMGCPAKKVCKKLAGSALMKDTNLVRDILTAVVASVDAPVTLKIRTGWDPESRNAVEIARIAEDLGVQSLAVHGRTRACRFRGLAEYDTIAKVVQAVNIPVFANGDINSAIKAKTVMDYTGADGIMIGRGAQGRPWIFSEINDLLDNKKAKSELFTAKSLNLNHTRNQERFIMDHLLHIHDYYHEICNSDNLTKQLEISLKSENCKKKRNIEKHTELAVRISRKHICWYFEQMIHALVDLNNKKDLDSVVSQELKQEAKRLITNIETAKKQFNQLSSRNAQLEHVEHFFGELHTTGDMAA